MIQKTIDASLIFHVIKLADTWKKRGDIITQHYGITTQQWFILLLLANDPNFIYLEEHPQQKPLLAKELAEALNVSRANITNLLNVLLRKQLVLQVEDKLDKRRKRLTLTKQGVSLVKGLEELRNQYNDKLFEGFSEKRKKEAITFMDECLKKMRT